MLLKATNVQKTFGELHVLGGVGLSVEKGDVVSILGPSGSGKTTLLRCLNFLERADDGQLEFDGRQYAMARMSGRDIADIRKKTGFVFQSYNLFANKTALQNVTEGLIVARKMPRAQAEEMVSETEIMQKAREEARATVNQALAEASDKRMAAAGYADGLLDELDKLLTEMGNHVRSKRSELAE